MNRGNIAESFKLKAGNFGMLHRLIISFVGIWIFSEALYVGLLHDAKIDLGFGNVFFGTALIYVSLIIVNRLVRKLYNRRK